MMHLNALINVIKSTKEYNQYQTLLKKVKKMNRNYMEEYVITEEKKVSLCSFRIMRIFIQENNNLQNEFADLLNIGLSNEYFAAEHQYCGMIRKIQECYLEEISIETGFSGGIDMSGSLKCRTSVKFFRRGILLLVNVLVSVLIIL